MEIGVKLFFKGKKFVITSERQQILDLLLSTYETAVIQNNELKAVQEKLETLNEQLERKVEERTSELLAEIEERKKAEEEIKRRALQEAEEFRKRQEVERALQEETAERLRAVEALREKERLLIQQSRQAAMGEMIGNIAHQWRQPLNTLGLMTQQLLMFYDLGDFNREFLDKSVLQSMDLIHHMSKTIDDFRNYFRPDKEKVEFRVAEAIENTLSLINDSFKDQHINIEIVEKNDPTIYGYQNEFAQALLNILNNARDALTEREIADPRVIITLGNEADRTVVTISDNAGGIPEEIIGKIFDPYFTTKGPQAGTGVGLFMSKTIVEKSMGGILAVCNNANGAEFRIEV
jgi:C4-dicarboxylate-specific signal transduction histidine kinase